MSEQFYPYLIQPKVVPAIWGGDALVRRFGKPGDPAAKLGESWECWDENTVLNGPLAGKTIAQLRALLGASFLGNLDPNELFPILTKIIDARDALSVQVHPDDAYAQRVEHQRNGKTECWYVLDAQPDAQLVLGWTADTTREEYERRVADGSLGDILRRVPVNPGDAFYLPAGTLHAIGKGIVIFETQQASDLTYRIFDWNRTGADGKPRELHVQKAGDVLDYHRGETGAVRTIEYELEGVGRTALISDPRFLVERIEFTEVPHRIHTEGRPLIFMALDRGLRLQSANEPVDLLPFQTAIIPADAGHVHVRADAGRAAAMFVTPPARADAMEERLQTAGVPQTAIDAFLKQFAPAVRT